jgi:hypothetical protein
MSKANNVLNSIKNTYSINARILRERAYEEGREAAKTGEVCPYDYYKNHVQYNAWTIGYGNYMFEKEVNLVGFKSLSVGV